MSMNLWTARGRVREVKPSATPSQVEGFLNRRIANVLDTRTWSDCMKIGMVTIPAAFTTGTVDLTSGSNLVTGHATAWPVHDAINVVSTQAITDVPGFVEIFPTATALPKIQPGSLLLLDQENSSVTEILTVQSVGPESFTAYCQYAHAVNVTLQQSSLAGLQFSAGMYVYTVQAVLAATSLQLDMAYGGPAQSAVTYIIQKRYCQISPTAKYLKYAWDTIAGREVGTQRDESWVQMWDPQGASTGDPQELAMAHPAPGGVMQWLLWPPQPVAYAIAVFYQDGWPVLKYDTDLLPPFINAEVFIAGAIADALRTKCIKKAGDRDDWYDPGMANSFWEPEYGRLLEAATQSDQGRRLSYLTNYREECQKVSTNWLRNHAVSAGGGWW